MYYLSDSFYSEKIFQLKTKTMKTLFMLCIIFVLLAISVAVPTNYVLNGQHRELAGKNIFLRVIE